MGTRLAVYAASINMEEIVQQVGALLVGAMPTVVLFIVLVLSYQFLVQGPLTATLKQRRARTDGAIEDAHKAIAQAEARAAEYAAKLRLARAEVYKVREQRVKQGNAERDAALEAARKVAALKRPGPSWRPRLPRLDSPSRPAPGIWPIGWFGRFYHRLPGVPVEIFGTFEFASAFFYSSY
jgi:F-type H+-transporting ATPase subunit b